MRSPLEVAVSSLMQTMHATQGMPDALMQAFLVVDRVWPDWRPPVCNLANPPQVTEIRERGLQGDFAYTCPVCRRPRHVPIERDEDLLWAMNMIATFRASALCAHDDPQEGMSIDGAPNQAA